MDKLPKSREIARAIRQPIGQLDAMIVPLVAGGRDSHGRPIGDDDELVERLSQAIGDALVALQEAQNELARMHAGA